MLPGGKSFFCELLISCDETQISGNRQLEQVVAQEAGREEQNFDVFDFTGLRVEPYNNFAGQLL